MEKMGVEVGGKGESLALGFTASGLLLGVFTLIKSSISLLLVLARAGSNKGFPFLFETVLVFPFAMQTIYYTGQTCTALGDLRAGLAAIKAAAPSMGPCLFYAGFITSTTLLETYSLQFILPSTFVVLKQLTMVVIAVGEVIMFAARPSKKAWLLIFAQVLCVGLFQCSSSQPIAHRVPSVILGGTPSVHKVGLAPNIANMVPGVVLGMSAWAAGMSACLLSVATGGFGSILQQHFMQGQAKAIPVSIKLFYQHVIELFWVMILLSSDRNQLWTDGFFAGWNRWTFLVSLAMWFSFLSASAISANISALAGAFAIAVSVALTGVLECSIFGREFSREQFALMGMVCVIAMLYTRERLEMFKDDPAQRKVLQKQLK